MKSNDKKFRKANEQVNQSNKRKPNKSKTKSNK